ncbi:MAG: TIM barrel protein [Planctomycetota bacterium]
MWDTYAFGNHFITHPDRTFEFAEVWDQTLDSGVQGIHFSIGRDNEDQLRRGQSLTEHRRRTGLNLASILTHVDLSNPDPDGAPPITEVMDLLEPGDTHEMGITMGWQQDVSDPKHDEQAIQILRKYADEAEARDLTVSLYPHFGFWLERVSDAVRLARAIDHPRLRVSFCGFHWYLVEGGDPTPTLREAAPWLRMVNVCGSRPTPEGHGFPLPNTIEPVGEGEFPLDTFVTALREVDYRGPVGFQGYLMGGDPLANLTQSYGAWRAAEARVLGDAAS